MTHEELDSEFRVFVDFDYIERVLGTHKPKRVGIAAPDGLQSVAMEVYDYLRGKGLDPIILLDPTYGSCDLQDLQAEALNLDLVLNLGHTINAQPGKKTFIVGVEYVVSSRRLNKLAGLLVEELTRSGFKRVSILTTSNYIRSLGAFKEEVLKLAGGEIHLVDKLVNSSSYLLPSQVLGCNFTNAWGVKDQVDCFAVFGGSMFHAIGVYLSTKKPTLVVNPETLEVLDVREKAMSELKRAVVSVYKAATAKKIAVIVGLKRGWPSQMFLHKALEVKRELEALGKEVVLVALTEVTKDRLALLKDVDAFVETACPRIPFDIHGLNKPILSYPQAVALINLLKGHSLSSLFENPVWT